MLILDFESYIPWENERIFENISPLQFNFDTLSFHDEHQHSGLRPVKLSSYQ